MDTTAGLGALKPAYDQLHLASGNAIPFALHEWHMAWWKHFAKADGRVRDELRIHVVRDDRGDCVAIVPFVSTRRAIGRLRSEALALLGADPNFTEIRGPLVVPGCEAAAAAAVAKQLSFTDGWDWIRWDGIQGHFGNALADENALSWQRPASCYIVDLPPSWEAFRAGLKRNIRESLRHCYNSLKRDGLVLELEVAETPDAVRNGLHLFLSLHAMRAGLTQTVQHPHRFDSQVSREFLYDVCDRLAVRGAARVFLLRVRGCVVAARVGFVVGDHLYLYYSGFDPRWSKYSVPTTVVAEAMKYAIDRGLTALNLSTGTDVSKTRWGARRVVLHEAVQVHPRLRSRVAYGAYRRLRNPMGGGCWWSGPLARMLPRRAWD